MAWNASRRPTRTRTAIGNSSGLIITIQCWRSFRTRFSPGISWLLISSGALFWPELVEDDERTRREEGAVGYPALHSQPPGDHQEQRDDAREEDAEEERGDDGGVVDAHDQADQGDQLDVAETERVGAEEEGADQRQNEEEEARAEPGQDALQDPQVRGEEAEPDRHHQGWEDHPVEDQPVLEVAEDHLHQHRHPEALDEQHGDRAEVEAEGGEEDRGQDRRPPDLPALGAELELLLPVEPDVEPADAEADERADDQPRGRGEERGGQVARAARIASEGAGRDVHPVKDAAPWATSTAQPSATGSPAAFAAATSGVPPAT